jgi:hypothetical protein
MRIKSIALAVAALALIPTAASADIVTVTYTGNVTGTDSAGYFGAAGTSFGTGNNTTTFTATYVFNTNLNGAGQYNNGNSFETYGSGSSSPAISASLLINGQTFNVPNVSQSPLTGSSTLSLSNVANTGHFIAEASVSNAAMGNYISTIDPNAPVLTSLNTPFSYSLAGSYYYLDQEGQFDFGGDNLVLFSETVALSPVPLKPSIWANLIFGFLGLGWMAYRRKNQRALTTA